MTARNLYLSIFCVFRALTVIVCSFIKKVPSCSLRRPFKLFGNPVVQRCAEKIKNGNHNDDTGRCTLEPLCSVTS